MPSIFGTFFFQIEKRTMVNNFDCKNKNVGDENSDDDNSIRYYPLNAFEMSGVFYRDGMESFPDQFLLNRPQPRPLHCLSPRYSIFDYTSCENDDDDDYYDYDDDCYNNDDESERNINFITTNTIVHINHKKRSAFSTYSDTPFNSPTCQLACNKKPRNQLLRCDESLSDVVFEMKKKINNTDTDGHLLFQCELHDRSQPLHWTFDN